MTLLCWASGGRGTPLPAAGPAWAPQQEKGTGQGTVFQVLTDCWSCQGSTAGCRHTHGPRAALCLLGVSSSPADPLHAPAAAAVAPEGGKALLLELGNHKVRDLHAKHREANAETCFRFQCMFISVLYLFQASAYYMDIIHVGYLNSGA